MPYSCWCVTLRHRVSKFSQIASKSFKDFVENILWIRTTLTMNGCGTCLVYLAHTVTVSFAQAGRYQQSILQRYLFGSLAQGCCPSTVLQSVWGVFVAHQKFGWNIFASGGRFAIFAKLKIRKKFSPIQYWHPCCMLHDGVMSYNVIWHHGLCCI